MSQLKLEVMTSGELVEQFAAIALQQDEALLHDELAKFNRLYGQMDQVEAELRSRLGEQRRELLSLYDHPNIHVRLKAAARTLAVAPREARQLLETIANSRKFPQAGDAGMLLAGLDDGSFQPT